jgi:predicted nicotinamide N-methyase
LKCTKCIVNNNFKQKIKQLHFKQTKLESQLLHWGDYRPTTEKNSEEEKLETANSKYDLIIGSDCLFFEEFHHDLLCFQSLLADNGKILLMQPNRGDSMKWFID